MIFVQEQIKTFTIVVQKLHIQTILKENEKLHLLNCFKRSNTPSLKAWIKGYMQTFQQILSGEKAENKNYAP